MQNQYKTKAQLVAELTAASQQSEQLQQQIAELEDFLTVVGEREQLLMVAHREKASLEAMYQATTALYSTLQYDQVLDRILEQLSQIVPHDAASIMLTQGKQARIFRWHGYGRFGAEKAISALTLNIAETPYLATLQQAGLPRVVPRVAEADPWIALSGQHWVNSYLAAPIRVGNYALGFVNVDSATPGFFNEEHAEHLQAFLSHAVVALKNARLYGEARREIMQRVKALKAERNFVWTVLDQAGALVVILDAEQRIIRFNQACEKLTGYSLEEVRNKHLWELFATPDNRAAFKAVFERLVTSSLPLQYESEWLTREGRLCVIDWSSTPLRDHQDRVEYIVNTGHDITERKQIEEALRRGGERYALAVQAANDGLWDWNLATDEIYFSPRWKTMLGYAEEEIPARVEEWFNRVHPEDLARLRLDIGLYLEGAAPNFRCEYRMLHHEGDYRWVLSQGLAVRDMEGRAYRLTGSQTDITGRKKNEDQLIHDSLHDALTGLPNRVFFMKRLEQALQRTKTDKDYAFAVLFLDLDRFKVINDNLGHLVGDQLLITVAHRFRASLRAGDIVARLAGDEFTILLEGISQVEEAVRVAERIQIQLATPVYLGGQEIKASASIGIALSSAGYNTPEDILRDADATMYQVKAQGRGSHLVFDSHFLGAGEKLQVEESELRQALDRQELQLYYQPLVALGTGQIVGVEALLRWHHPQRGLIGPDDFIPLAEASGLIVPLGQWVLRTACQQAQQWHKSGYPPLRISVNLSLGQLQAPRGEDLPAMIAAILQETGLAADKLELEITESFPLVDNEFNQNVLGQLKKLGVRLALDDFGLNSSLGLLRQFPVDTLKIDRSFVQDMVKKAESASLVVALISMAHAFQLKVVAEGVETAEQLAYLQLQRCDEVQGYLFSPPVPASEFSHLLIRDT
jgi:diguanylate cyclase (GGDEF)-like protein/PAS domain S-box-containing protein